METMERKCSYLRLAEIFRSWSNYFREAITHSYWWKCELVQFCGGKIVIAMKMKKDTYAFTTNTVSRNAS